MTKEQLEEYGKSLPMGTTFDKDGNLLTCRESDGYWEERTYKNGKILTRKTSDGYWSKATYDKNGNELTYKNSDGLRWEWTYDKNGNQLTCKYGIKGETNDN